MFRDKHFKQLIFKTLSYLRIEPCENGLVSGQVLRSVAKRKIWKVQEINMFLCLITLTRYRDIPR